MQITAPDTQHNVKLTSAEIASLWSSYQNDSLAICMLSDFLAHVEDVEIRSILDYAMQVSKAHIAKLKSFFNEEQFPVPDGFSEQADFIKGAPRLFTDDFYLFYIQNIGKIGMTIYSMFLSKAARLDICEYYTECLNESSKLLNKSTERMLIKGTFIRAPYIPTPTKVEYIQKKSYLSGFFGNHRPLSVIEMSNIYFNLIQNQLGRTLIMGFSQVAKSKQVRDYMVRGRDISDKHVEIFGSVLSIEYLPSASAWNTLPTSSTTSPFSDKLMMFHVASLNAAGIGNYGFSLGSSPRSDLGAHYIRLMAEIMQFTEDGATLMIENGWLEQPPQAVDRDKLASEK
ncbi:MAG: hypothetical protein JWM44_3536 [Bacilli bacterium]|nr:hypothetical protein [Bacilli bacterium]